MHRVIFVEADKTKAQEWYEKSLKAMLVVEDRKENTYLEYRIGKMYQYGLGTEENLPEAAKWFEIASGKEHNMHFILLVCCICMEKVWSRTREKPVSCFSVPIKRAILMHPLSWGNCMKPEEEPRGIRIWRRSATG